MDENGNGVSLEIKRQRMVQEQLINRGISDERVLAAMSTVPRHRFVPENVRHLAYKDGPLPIGAEQTISQPYIVGLMTQLARVKPTDHVLEIGVGSGYQTAVLAEIADGVLGIERVEPLARRAGDLLKTLGYDNVRILVGDGTQGAPDYAPFDVIMVAAAGPELPQPLTKQLAEGGRLVIPVGTPEQQTLIRATRRGGTLHVERLTAVRFVPLIGAHGVDDPSESLEDVV